MYNMVLMCNVIGHLSVSPYIPGAQVLNSIFLYNHHFSLFLIHSINAWCPAGLKKLKVLMPTLLKNRLYKLSYLDNKNQQLISKNYFIIFGELSHQNTSYRKRKNLLLV